MDGATGRREKRSAAQALDDAFEDMRAVRSALMDMGAYNVLEMTEAVMDGMRDVGSALAAEGWVRE